MRNCSETVCIMGCITYAYYLDLIRLFKNPDDLKGFHVSAFDTTVNVHAAHRGLNLALYGKETKKAAMRDKAHGGFLPRRKP